MRKLEGTPLASFRKRAIAFGIDIVIAFLLFVLGLFLVGIIIWYRATRGEFTSYSFRFDPGAWYGRLIVQLLVPILYFGLSTYLLNGQTPGKKMLKIRVISLVHEKITFWDALERALGYGLSLVELGFGFWQYFTHPNHQTAEDCLAETIVIDDRGLARD
ncbi:MAG: RDD family protein [Candidatus Neomarinimicrobiota bacterium]